MSYPPTENTPGEQPPTTPQPAAPQPYAEPQYAAQPAYGAQQPGTYAPPAPGERTNTLAIIALILGILVPIGGIIAGHIALSQIKRTGEAGHGLALAGTVIGYVLTLGYIILGVFWLLLVLFAIQQGDYTGYIQ